MLAHEAWLAQAHALAAGRPSTWWPVRDPLAQTPSVLLPAL